MPRRSLARTWSLVYVVGHPVSICRCLICGEQSCLHIGNVSTLWAFPLVTWMRCDDPPRRLHEGAGVETQTGVRGVKSAARTVETPGTPRLTAEPAGPSARAQRRARRAQEQRLRADPHSRRARLGPHRSRPARSTASASAPCSRAPPTSTPTPTCASSSRTSTTSACVSTRPSTSAGWTGRTSSTWPPRSRASTCGPSAASGAGFPPSARPWASRCWPSGSRPASEAHVPAQLTPLTPKTLADREALVGDLKLTRERGYAIDNEENYAGVKCFGFALRYSSPADRRDQLLGAHLQSHRGADAGDHRGDGAHQAGHRADGPDGSLRHRRDLTVWIPPPPPCSHWPVSPPAWPARSPAWRRCSATRRCWPSGCRRSWPT